MAAQAKVDGAIGRFGAGPFDPVNANDHSIPAHAQLRNVDPRHFNGVYDAGNVLEIEVANRWPNRLLGDSLEPDKNVRTVKWDSGFLEGKEFKTGRRYPWAQDRVM